MDHHLLQHCGDVEGEGKGGMRTLSPSDSLATCCPEGGSRLNQVELVDYIIGKASSILSNSAA